LWFWIITSLQKAAYFSKNAYGKSYNNNFYNTMTKWPIRIYLSETIRYNEYGYPTILVNKDYWNNEETIKLIKEFINSNSDRIKVITIKVIPFLVQHKDYHNSLFITFLILDDKSIFNISLPHYHYNKRSLTIHWRHSIYSTKERKIHIIEELENLMKKRLRIYRNYIYKEDISHKTYLIIKHILNEHDFSISDESK
jgi:hypothetical protein